MRLALLWLCSSVFLASSLEQPGIDLFRAQVVECRIDKRPRRKHETVSDQDRVNREIRCYVPKLLVPLAATTLMP
jgi:hypothetical protein